MPLIYTANKLQARSIQSPDFIQRGIDGLNTGRLEDLHFVGLPDRYQPHYPQYIGNLSAFLHATATQRRVICGGSYFPSIDPSLLLPLPLPPITLAPYKPFQKEEDKAAFIEKLPSEVHTTVYLRRECYVVSNLTPSQLVKLPPTDPNVPSSPDSVSLSGMRQFLTTLKIVTLFLSTHTYPAFQTDDDDGTLVSADQDMILDEALKRRACFRGREDLYKIGRKVTGYVKGDSIYQEGVSYDEESEYSVQGTVHVAKPAPLYPSVNYGPPSVLPNLPGFVFPYFHGMIYPSESNIITIMRRFFLACFGTTTEDRNSRWETWVKSVSKWHRTASGMSLGHILFCMQTALECQGRLFVIISQGKYVGCSVLGYKMHISLMGTLVSPDDATTVRKLVMDLDEHSRAMAEITTMLKAIALKGQTDIDMDVEVDVSTPRALYRELCIREAPDSDSREQLAEKVQKLCYHQKYWSISGENLKRAIDLLLSDDDIPSDLPMYADPLCIFDEQSRIFPVFSAFGPTAPSLIDAGGVDVRIPEGLQAPDPQSEIPQGEASIRMPKIFVTAKKLHVACNDWRGIIKKRKIRQNQVERAGGFRTIALAGKQRDMVWGALKMIPVRGSVEKGKGKRLAEDEGDKEGRAEKRPTVELIEEGLGEF